MKKKLLAFVLAVLMVAAMVCSTAVSVIAATEPEAAVGGASSTPSVQSTTGGDGQDEDAPAVEYPEVARDVAVAELLDEKGNFLANLAVLDATTIAYVQDGYTIRLLKDISASAALTVSTPGVTWTLDAIKEDGTAATYTYTGTGYAMTFNGADQYVTVKSLKLNSAKGGIKAGDGNTSTALLLDNVQVRTDGSTATTTAKTAASTAIYNHGADSFLKITGSNTVVQSVGSTSTSSGEAVRNTGYLEIYDGYFYTNASVSGVIHSTSTSTAAKHSNAKVSIYGGTFVSGPTAYSVITVSGGSVVSISGGNFIFGFSGTVTNQLRMQIGVVRMAKTGYGYLFVSGGNFYNTLADLPIFNYLANAAAKVYINLSGGNFYANKELNTQNNPLTQTFGTDATGFFRGETANYGTIINELYKITAETLADNTETADVVENQFTAVGVGVPAGEYAATLASIATFTCTYKETVAYDTESDAYKNANFAFSVTNPHTQKTTQYLDTELYAALAALPDGASLVLLRNVAYNHAISSGYRPAAFQWTLTSSGKTAYALTITVEATNTDANAHVTTGYAFYVYGGTMTLQNVGVVNPLGGIFVLEGNTVFNVEKGTELSFGVTSTDISTNAVCANGGEINVYPGAYLYPPAVKNMKMAIFRLFGAVKLTIHEDAKVGYNRNNKVPEESGGYLLWIGHKDAEVHCYGEVAADYGRAVQGRDTANLDGDTNEGGKLYVYDGAEFSAKRSNAGVITLYDTTVYILGGEFHQPTTAGAENSIFMIVAAQTKLYIRGGTYCDSISSNGRMIMSKADSYVEITGGYFYAVSHSIVLFKDVAPRLVIKNGVDEDGNVISVPHFYGPNGKPILDLRTNTKCEISGGYFWANYTGPLIQMYAAGLTITGGEFYNMAGNFLAITKQSGDAKRNVVINDVYIDGTNCTFQYKNRFLDVASENSATAADSPGARTITVKNVTVSGASHFLYMKACDAHVIFENVTATTTDAEGMWITSGNGSITFNNCNLTAEHGALMYLPSSDTTAYHVTFNGGTYQAATYVIRCLARTMADEKGVKTGITINGGTFKPYDNSKFMTACVSMEAGICTINGGTFVSNGSCVLYAGAGEVNTYLDRIYKISTAALTVNDGYFVLAENGRGLATDAVVKCGSETAYAAVNLNGGVFVSNREGCEQVIAKNNEFCTLNVGTPVLMANPDADAYIMSADSADNVTLAVDPEADPTVEHEDDAIKYYVKAFAEPDLAAIGADLMILLADNGLVYMGYFDAGLEAEMGDVLTTGVLIAAKEDVEAAGELTVDALTTAGKSYTVITEADSQSFGCVLGITVANFAVDVANYDTEYYFVGFVALTVGDETYYIYNIAIEEAISVRATAQAALDDVQDTACEIDGVSYEYKSIIDETKYSPYTAEEQAALKAIVDAQVPTT